MRVHQVHCPKCEATLKSQAGIPVGQTVSCPKCKHRFAVEAADEPEIIDAEVVEDEDRDEDRRPARRKGASPGPRKTSRHDQDDEDASRPRKERSGGSRRHRDEDDDEDRPRKKKRGRRRDDGDESEGLYWRLRRNVAVRVITLVVLLGILAILAYLLYEKKKAERALENSSRGSPAYALSRVHVDSVSTGRPNSGRVSALDSGRPGPWPG